MRLLVKTLPGFSDFAVKEIKGLLGRDSSFHEVLKDYIVVESRNITTDVTLLVLFSETIQTFFLEIGGGEVSNPEDAYQVALTIPWHEYWPPNLTFAVRPVVKDPSLIKALGKNIGQAIVDTFVREKQIKPKVDLSNPDIEIMAWLINNNIILALNLCGEVLNSDEEILARSMLIATEWNKKDSLGEIFCAGIGISALRYALNEARRERLSRRAFIKFNFIDRKTILDLVRKNWRKNISIEISCYVRKERLQIVREEMPEIRKLKLKTVGELVDGNEKILVSNFLSALEKKTEQIKWSEKLSEILIENQNWDTLTLLIREDVIDKIILNNKSFERDIIFKGINAKMVKYIH